MMHKQSRVFASAVLVAAFATGCFSTSVNPEVIQTKAASDFECTAEKVKVSQINDNNWKAKGCGKKATYICSGSNFMSDGTCMREGAMP